MEARLWDLAAPVTHSSNAFLQPPPPHAIGLVAAAAADERVARAFADNLNDPAAAWAAFG